MENIYLLAGAQNGGTWQTATHLGLVVGTHAEARAEAENHAERVHGGAANIDIIALDPTKPIIVKPLYAHTIRVTATELSR